MSDLKSFRERASLTQEDAAVKLGIHWSTLHRWERGVSRIPTDIIPKVKVLYNISDAELVSFFD